MDIEKDLLNVIKEKKFKSIDDIRRSIADLQRKIQLFLIQKIEREECFSHEQIIGYKNLAGLWTPNISWRWRKISVENEDGNVIQKYYEAELLTTSKDIEDMLSNYMDKLKNMQEKKYLKFPESVLLSTLNSMDKLLKPEHRNAITDVITQYYDVKIIDYDNDHMYCFDVSQGNIPQPVTTIKAIIGPDDECLAKGTYVIPLIPKKS